MKRYLSLYLLGFFVSLIANAVPVEPVSTLQVPYASPAPVLDGVRDNVYTGLQSTDYIYPDQLIGFGGESDFKADFALCWDEDFLYLYAEFQDDVEHNFQWEIGNWWEFDFCWVFLQLDTNTVTTTYGPNTVYLAVDRGLDSVYEPGRAARSDYGYYMDSQTPTGWITEVAIPWTAVISESGPPEDIMDYISPRVIGFDFMAGDSDNTDGDENTGNRDYQTSWDLDGQDGMEDLAWNNTSVFGYIELITGSINLKPDAEAGPNQVVNEGELVTLDGSGSSDPEGESITYTWYPADGITLSDIHAANPTFTAPIVQTTTNFQIGLIVNDGVKNSLIDSVTITVNSTNQLPTAIAGPDQSVDEGELVTLDGSGSSDPEGESITYTWYPTYGIVLSDIHAVYPTFTAPDVQTTTNFEIGLVVNDGVKNSLIDYVTITVNHINQPPVANAGDDINAKAGELIALNADNSYDPDGLVYLQVNWTPLQDTKIVQSSNYGEILFTTPVVFENTSLKFKLEVSDGQDTSDPDTVTVNIAGLNQYQDTLHIVNYTNNLTISVIDKQNIVLASEVDGSLHVRLFPNPADFYINLASDAQIHEIELLDIAGNIINIYADINDVSYQLNLARLAAGSYVLRISTEGGIVIKQLIVE